MNDQNRKKLLIGACAFIFIGIIAIAYATFIGIIAIAYATFIGNLNINGTGVNRKSNFDIYFNNVSNFITTGTASVVDEHPTSKTHTTIIEDYEATPITPTKKSNEEIADEVINGKWGNGDDRKKRLMSAGYDYNAIQSIVNQRLGSKPTKRYHTVVKGDTLFGIAKKYYGNGNRYPEIARANGISNPNVIRVGQKLLIP